MTTKHPLRLELHLAGIIHADSQSTSRTDTLHHMVLIAPDHDLAINFTDALPRHECLDAAIARAEGMVAGLRKMKECRSHPALVRTTTPPP